MTFDKLASLANNYIVEAKRKVRPPTEKERTKPYEAYKYAKNVVKGRVPELEPLILTDMASTYDYTFNLVKGRWPQAEQTFANGDPGASVSYAERHLKKRWIDVPKISKDLAFEAELNILQYPDQALRYALDVIQGRWPEAEPSIFTDLELKQDYMKGLNKLGYSEAEESFKLYFTEANVRPPTKQEKEDFALGLNYAKNVLHGRWPELEQRLLNLGSAAILSLYTYAKEVIKGRWPEAEPFIIDAGTVAPDYARDVIKGRWPELEKSLLENIDFYGEEIDEFTLEVIMYYIYEVVKGRWEEVEPFILQFDNLKQDYIDFLNELNYQDLEESYKLR